MSKHLDDDGFQIVTSKRASKNKQTKIPHNQKQFIKHENNINIEASYCRILSAVDDIKSSHYFNDVLKSVSNVLKERNLLEIVCFGLGHIGECNISRYQLAFLLCLKQSFNLCDVFVHDPIFYSDECELLRRLGLTVITQNNEGCYVISQKHTTLVYLPHCPKQLTNNFLWSNWGVQLENCILLCNSFASLLQNQPSRILKEAVPYIYKITSHIDEIVLKNNFQYKDIFNDTSIHYISKEKLPDIDSEFWNKTEQPKYEDIEEFITSQMVEKLSI
ncbi:SRR1-like protein isoform X1 [Battus philenor]|uniref:SRR1-like protein isoform X1 n=1 Tax=Battus philenor TaxID=42288 RepID=UPI0035CE8873